jgi:hypothetical protein
VTNGSTGAVTVPITAPPGSVVNNAAFGQSYGGTVSAWVTLGAGASTVISTPASFVAPAFTSAASVTGSMLAGLNFTVTTSGYPAAVVTETGSLPAGLTFTAGSNGTATITGTPVFPGSTTITLTAKSAAGTVNQTFTITVNFLLGLVTKPKATTGGAPSAPPTATPSATAPAFSPPSASPTASAPTVGTSTGAPTAHPTSKATSTTEPSVTQRQR